MNLHPLTIWLTGLPSSGKSTIAFSLQQQFSARQIASVVLDGDELRHGLTKDLDLSNQGRKENVRRCAEVCKLLMKSGIVSIVALVSPFEEDRQSARACIGEGRFMLIYLNCPAAVCYERDVKGLYRKAREGRIKGLTGFDAPYESPRHPDLSLNTDVLSLSMSTKIIYDHIEKFQLYPRQYQMLSTSVIP